MDKLLSRDECKQIQINILNEIATICETNGLQYYLAYGTLLGAVRHEGFIPWDDDIDIYLSRNDYDKLAMILKNPQTVKPAWLEYYDGDKEGYYYPFAKAVDNTTIAKMENNITQHGIWIDIFPMDNIPNSHKEQEKYVKKGKFLRDISIAMTTDFSTSKGGAKMLAKRFLNFFAVVIGRKRVYKNTVKHYTKFKGLDSSYVACMCGAYGTKDIHSREDIFTPATVAFEGEKYQATQYWDNYLKQLYGDYMKLPSEENRKEHSITAWKIESIS